MPSYPTARTSAETSNEGIDSRTGTGGVASWTSPSKPDATGTARAAAVGVGAGAGSSGPAETPSTGSRSRNRVQDEIRPAVRSRCGTLPDDDRAD